MRPRRVHHRSGRSLVITPIRCVLGWNWTPREQLGTALPIVRNSWGPKTHELRQQTAFKMVSLSLTLILVLTLTLTPTQTLTLTLTLSLHRHRSPLTAHHSPFTLTLTLTLTLTPTLTMAGARAALVASGVAPHLRRAARLRGRAMPLHARATGRRHLRRA